MNIFRESLAALCPLALFAAPARASTRLAQ